MSTKLCKGIPYKISGKSYCVGERKTKTKTKRITRTYVKKTKKTKSIRKIKSIKKLRARKTRKNVARVPGDDDYYDITQCCMCSKNVNVNDKTNALIPLECLQKHGNRAHRICKECWFRPKTGFAIEGVSHKCPGCEKGLPLTLVKIKTPEFIDLTNDSD
jgi:hypothetical protein